MLIKLERGGGCPRFVGAFPSLAELKENRKSEEEGRPCVGLAVFIIKSCAQSKHVHFTPTL